MTLNDYLNINLAQAKAIVKEALEHSITEIDTITLAYWDGKVKTYEEILEVLEDSFDGNNKGT